MAIDPKNEELKDHDLEMVSGGAGGDNEDEQPDGGGAGGAGGDGGSGGSGTNSPTVKQIRGQANA